MNKQVAAGLEADCHAAAESIEQFASVNGFGRNMGKGKPVADGFLSGDAGLLDLDGDDGNLLSPSNNFLEEDALDSVSPNPEPEFLGPPSSRPQHLPPSGPPAAAAHASVAAHAPAVPQVDPNPPKIRVVVRKRPLNRREVERADEDIVDVLGGDFMQVCSSPLMELQSTHSLVTKGHLDASPQSVPKGCL
jgi:hypothetical protein